MRKNWKNFKFRWKGLLEKHFPFATVNVKIYQKNRRFFVHTEDIVDTDGKVHGDFVHNFSYVIVMKCIERRETRETAPKTYHLDIKVYFAFDFNPEHLPKISDFWGEYLDKAVKEYLVSPKILP